MAGVGVGLDQVVLLVKRLFGQILLQEKKKTRKSLEDQSLRAIPYQAGWPDKGLTYHIGVFHPVDAVPVTQVSAPLLVIVAGVR